MLDKYANKYYNRVESTRKSTNGKNSYVHKNKPRRGNMIIYLQSHRRRPVRLTPLLPHEDVQGAVPYGWCGCCGAEVYRQMENLCEQCRKEKKYATVY